MIWQNKQEGLIPFIKKKYIEKAGGYFKRWKFFFSLERKETEK